MEELDYRNNPQIMQKLELVIKQGQEIEEAKIVLAWLEKNRKHFYTLEDVIFMYQEYAKFALSVENPVDFDVWLKHKSLETV